MDALAQARPVVVEHRVGRPLARLGEEEGLAIAEIDTAVVAQTRAAHRMVHDHRSSLGPRVRD